MDNYQITKKQHYVPEFLLKNFCSSDGKFAAYNIQYKSYSRKSPAQVCYKDFLYETRNNNDEFIRFKKIIDSIDTNKISPLEALLKLYEIKKISENIQIWYF